MGPAGGCEGQALPAPRPRPTADRCTTAIRSHRPSRSGRRYSRASVSRRRPRASGSTPGQRPGIGVLDRDPVARLGRESQRLVGHGANGKRWCLQGRLTKGRDFRGVALGVGGRGRDDRQPGRRREGDGEDSPARSRRSSPPASPGRPRPRPSRRSVGGAGEEVDAKGRVGRAAAQPALETGRRRSVTKIGKFWRLFGPWRGEEAVVRHPVVAEVDGLSRIGEDAVGRDLVADGEVAR